MTTLPAARRMHKQVEQGIRPFDIGRDLKPVAELIARAFANELDSRGTAALREMHIMGHMSGIIRLLNRSTGEFNDMFSGFVWLEEGRVVGNVTVQRAANHSERWQIANVAVAQKHRGRGIARQLLWRALDHIRSSGGRWAVLQVYENNNAARHLYINMGFENVGGTVDLKIDRIPTVEAPVQQVS